MSTTQQTQVSAGIIGPARFSYLNFFEPKAQESNEGGNNNGKKFYSVVLLIPKTETAMKAKIESMIKAAIEQGIAAKKINELHVQNPKFWNPLQDGDLKINKKTGKKDETYAGHWFISCKSEEKNGRPHIVDSKGVRMLSPTPDDVYSGMYGRAHVNFSAFNKVSFGIGAYLNHLQKVKDGEKFGGRVDSDNLFNDGAVFSDEIDLDA